MTVNTIAASLALWEGHKYLPFSPFKDGATENIICF